MAPLGYPLVPHKGFGLGVTVEPDRGARVPTTQMVMICRGTIRPVALLSAEGGAGARPVVGEGTVVVVSAMAWEQAAP
jgi:hypothetical protein